MRCLIDIGVQKTGSKARQHFFMQQIAVKGRGGALYPSAGRAGVWHQPLFDALAQGDGDLLLQMRAEAASAGRECVVISYEGMHALDGEAIRRIAEAFPDLLVTVFVRRQDEFINSMHNQLHKSHRRSLHDLENFERRMFQRDPRCDFAAIVRRWAAAVGADRIRPLLYLRHQCAVQGFLRASGLPLRPPANGDYYCNGVIDTFGMAVLRQFKAMARNPEELPVLVQQAHRDLAPHFLSGPRRPIPWTISPDDRRRIMALYGDSNDWLRERYFSDAETLFPDSDQGSYHEYDPDQGQAFAAQIVARARQGLD